jgi:pimeloyl-ACP methyl ester carboxylesterase
MADSSKGSSRSFAEKLLRWLGRSVLALVALIVVLALAGAAYQIIGNWRDSRRFPQRGRSIQVGRLRLNLDCTGQGSPAVILESGSTIPALGWVKVQSEVAKFTRVCSYDRAGYGWSDAGPDPRTSLQIAIELKGLLNAAGEPGPYVMVGHSFGGFNIRVFTGQHPNDVVGMVLVDASSEDYQEGVNQLPSAVQKQQDEEEKLGAIIVPLIIRLGVARLFAGGTGSGYLPKELQEEMNYLSPKALSASASEFEHIEQSVAQVRSAGNLGDRPLIVLTAGKSQEDPSLPKKIQDEQQNLWTNVLQVAEAHLSTRGKQIVLPDSRHMIPFEHPEAIVAAIHEVWSTSGAPR